MVCIGVLLGIVVAVNFCSLCVLSAIYGEIKGSDKNG